MPDRDSSSSVVRLVILVLSLVVVGLVALVFVFGDFKNILLNKLGQSQLGQLPTVKKIFHIADQYSIKFQVISYLPQYRLDPDSLNYPLLIKVLMVKRLMPGVSLVVLVRGRHMW